MEKTVKIEQSKNTKPCPPFCIQPLKLTTNIDTFAELEVIEFFSNDVKSKKGLLVDARLPKYFTKETIPASINIPFKLFNGSNKSDVVKLLGVKEEDGKSDFSEVKTLCFFCDDSTCDESKRAISSLVKLGYPSSKLKYYRGGLKAWKALSLTTVSSDSTQTSTDQEN